MTVHQDRQERKIMDLAAMDWANIPTIEIRKHFKFQSTNDPMLSLWRSTPLYQQTMSELKRAWFEEMARLPSTSELKKKVQHAMALGLDRLVAILAAKATRDRDVISAVRLAAQMDGRFLGPDDSAGKLNPQTETLAQALLTEIKKKRETVQ